MLKPSLTLQYFVKFFITYIFLNQLGNAVRTLNSYTILIEKPFPRRKFGSAPSQAVMKVLQQKNTVKIQPQRTITVLKNLAWAIWKLKSYVGKQITEGF